VAFVVGVFVSRCLLACDCYYYLQRWKGFAGVFFVIWGGGVGRLGGRREGKFLVVRDGRARVLLYS
jgi:hypothetical protein